MFLQNQLNTCSTDKIYWSRKLSAALVYYSSEEFFLPVLIFESDEILKVSVRISCQLSIIM